MGAGPLLTEIGAGFEALGIDTPMSREGKRLGKRIKKETSRFGRTLKGFFVPEFPALAIPEEELERRAEIDDEEAARIARQRRALERRRTGRRSLRIDRPIRDPGIAASVGAGLRIPS